MHGQLSLNVCRRLKRVACCFLLLLPAPASCLYDKLGLLELLLSGLFCLRETSDVKGDANGYKSGFIGNTRLPGMQGQG